MAERPLAIVTGGWRRIGAAIARRLAQQGFDLALHAHHVDAVDDAFAAELGVNVRPVIADLVMSPEAMPVEVSKQWGRPATLLVNSASIFREDDIASMTRAELERHHTVNYMAPLLLTQGFAAVLQPAQQGSVVQIVDQRVVNPVPDQLSYTLSKQALHASVRTFARALAPQVRVNAVAPGPVLPNEDYDPEQWLRLADILPLSALPSPEQIAEAVAFLAGATSVTGQTIFVDGGAHLEAYPRDFVYLQK